MNSVAAVIVVMAYYQQQLLHSDVTHEQTVNRNCESDFVNWCVDESKSLELGELILGMLYFLGFEFNYITTGASADLGFFSRVDRNKSDLWNRRKCQNNCHHVPCLRMILWKYWILWTQQIIWGNRVLTFISSKECFEVPTDSWCDCLGVLWHVGITSIIVLSILCWVFSVLQNSAFLFRIIIDNWVFVENNSKYLVDTHFEDDDNQKQNELTAVPTCQYI